jgi:hypothetical protein
MQKEIDMEEIYALLEEKIREAGYTAPLSGREIYDEVCDEIEDKENGTYIFMSKKTEDTFFEYTIEIMDEAFNLSSILIQTPTDKIFVDLDA